jgi:hypothetical protein
VRHIEGGSSGDQGAGLRSRTLRMRERGGGLTSYFCPGGWVYSEPPPVGQSRYRSLQCRRRSRPPASGISYCRPPLDWLLFSDRFSSATKRAASPQRQNQCHDASRGALCSANWGGPLHKQNSYRHYDQGFYAGHGNTETNLAQTLSDWNSGCLLRTAFLPRHLNPNGSRGSRGIVPVPKHD